MSTSPSSQPSHEKLIAMVVERVTPFYQSLDAWHDLEHGSRVASFALQINQRENGDPLLVEAGAWLHQYHDDLDDVKALLEQLPFTDEQRSQLYEIVEQCRPHKISAGSSHEARIVFDADALDLMGPSGIFREVLCNAVARGLDPQKAISGAKDVQGLFEGKLQTEGGRILAKPAIAASASFWEEHQRWEAMLKSE